MPKRGNGEGSIAHRSDGRWMARLSYLDPVTGERRRLTLYAKTAREVRAKLAAARGRIDSDTPPKDATRTVGDWLKHWRATTLAASGRKASTRELYGSITKTHLEPAPFGAHRLDRLRPSDVEALMLELKSKLSDATIRSVYNVLRCGLDGAVRDGLLARNPAAAVKRPAVRRREARHLDAGEVIALLAAAAGSRHHLALVLIATTGLRRGECLALRWSDVDLETGAVTVAGTLYRIAGELVISAPKTAKSRRIVPLHPGIVATLRRHRVTQAAEKLRAGSQWQDTGLVFATELGGPVDPRTLLRVAQDAAAAAGVAGAGVHTLRHSAAVAWVGRPACTSRP